MTEPHTPRRKPQLSASDSITRSPYFDNALESPRLSQYSTQPERHAASLDKPTEEHRLEAESSPSCRSEPTKASHHFSLSEADMSIGLLPLFRSEAAIPTSLQGCSRNSPQAASGAHRSLCRDAAYCNFYDAFMRLFNLTYRAKPILIQRVLVDSCTSAESSHTLRRACGR